MNNSNTPICEPVNLPRLAIQELLERAENTMIDALSKKKLERECDLFRLVIRFYYTMVTQSADFVELNNEMGDVEVYFNGLRAMYELRGSMRGVR